MGGFLPLSHAVPLRTQGPGVKKIGKKKERELGRVIVAEEREGQCSESVCA